MQESRPDSANPLSRHVSTLTQLRSLRPPRRVDADSGLNHNPSSTSDLIRYEAPQDQRQHCMSAGCTIKPEKVPIRRVPACISAPPRQFRNIVAGVYSPKRAPKFCALLLQAV